MYYIQKKIRDMGERMPTSPPLSNRPSAVLLTKN
jgi:hypothetical protein